jgi:hypothetical protein
MSAIRPIGNSYSYAPWWCSAPGPACPGAAGTVPDAWIGESLAARGLLPRVPDITYFPNPIAHLSEALTIKNALWQHNVLGQTGVRSEHVGSLVVFAQFSAKAASLPAVMEAVWLSPEYASLAEAKRQLMLGPGASGSLDLWSTSGFPSAPPPIPALEGPIAGGHLGGQLNVMA